jgi:8-oxo-dGTP pyrophosphatase MutT (NUDIX family)
MKKVSAGGILLFSKKMKYFLLMKHPNRWDLPKGHLELGEDHFQGALREFQEETGIDENEISIFDGFRYEEIYYPIEKKYDN